MATSTALSSSMSQAIELLDALSTLLIAERTALKERDTLNIQSLLEQKSSLLAELQNNATVRSQLLVDAGYSGDETGMTACLEALPANAAFELKQQWQQLKEKLETCKAANQVNGTIVHRSQAQLDSLLNILRGQSGEQQLYTDAGKSASVGKGHSLAKA
ncbi:MAG: flagellar protein FlgN [Pseudomonadales bacterium]|jgi:flagellar biosynthesis/type III secretory pathway chaperone